MWRSTIIPLNMYAVPGPASRSQLCLMGRCYVILSRTMLRCVVLWCVGHRYVGWVGGTMLNDAVLCHVGQYYVVWGGAKLSGTVLRWVTGY